MLEEGTPHDVVAARMIEALDGHDLLASAPSWDGKWLSTLLRAAGLPRHRLRLRDSDDAMRETAESILQPLLPPDRLDATVSDIMADVEALVRANPPAHRALDDAQAERTQLLAVREAATRMVTAWVGRGESHERLAAPGAEQRIVAPAIGHIDIEIGRHDV